MRSEPADRQTSHPDGPTRLGRRRFLYGAAAGLVIRPLIAEAQAPKVYRIGMLERTSPAVNASNLDAFRQGLRELRYVEGKTSSSSTDRRTGATIDSPPWPRSSSARRWT